MGDPQTIIFKYEEIIEALLKHQGIHEGIWGLHIQFLLQVGNINLGPTKESAVPGLIIPMAKFGLQKFDKRNGITVDAAQVNPPPKP